MTAIAAHKTGWKGLRLSTLELFGVRVIEGGAVSVPFRDEEHRVVREKLFGPEGLSWWGPGSGSHLFGRERLPRTALVRRATAVMWCEGESDSLAFEEAFAGYWDEFAAFYVSIASPGASIVKPEWAALLHGFGLVYAAGDGDSAGRAFNERVAVLLPWARRLQVPDARDLRDLLQRDGRQTVLALMNDADERAGLFAAAVLGRDVDEFLAMAAIPGRGGS